MEPNNAQKNAFIIDEGVFYYKVISFGLKNASATYQYLVNTMLKDLIGRVVKVYVDDIIIKSRRVEDHARDIVEAIDLDKVKMKLNLKKCTFEIKASKFLDYILSKRGIESNLEKIRVIMDVQPPKNIKEVQKLNRWITTLSHFMSCLAKRCLPFYRALKAIKQFK